MELCMEGVLSKEVLSKGFCPEGVLSRIHFNHVSSFGPLVFCRSILFCFIPVVLCYLLLLYFLIVSCRVLFSRVLICLLLSSLIFQSMFLALFVIHCLPLPSIYSFAVFPDDVVSPLSLSLRGQSSARLTVILAADIFHFSSVLLVNDTDSSPQKRCCIGQISI